MRAHVSFFLLTLLFITAGCAGSRSAVAPHPMEGEWSYEVHADDGVYEGVLAFTAMEDGLTGTITGEGTEGVTELMDVAYDDARLSFEFESNEYGLLVADVNVAGDTFSGDLNVASYGTVVPMNGARISED
ncbi:MAG: hypothetical protein WD021_01320 [Rhodothermales bacterium]